MDLLCYFYLTIGAEYNWTEDNQVEDNWLSACALPPLTIDSLCTRIIWQYWQDQSSASSRKKYQRKYPKYTNTNLFWPEYVYWVYMIEYSQIELSWFLKENLRNALDYWLSWAGGWFDNIGRRRAYPRPLCNNKCPHVDLLEYKI